MAMKDTSVREGRTEDGCVKRTLAKTPAFCRSSCADRVGFTLVELLVVIAIIGVLVDNLPCSTGVTFLNQRMASRSRHPGGVNVVMCDVSVRYVSDDIDLWAWQVRSSMAGGDLENVIPAP